MLEFYDFCSIGRASCWDGNVFYLCSGGSYFESRPEHTLWGWPLRSKHVTLSNVKVKVIPQQAEVAQGVPGRLRPRIFLDVRHYKGGRSSAIRTGRLYPRRNPWYSFSEAESTPGHMVPSGGATEKNPVTPPGIDPGTVRLVAQCLNHYATPGPQPNLLW